MESSTMKCVVLVLSLLVSLTGADPIPARCCLADQFSAVYTDESEGKEYATQRDFTERKSEVTVCSRVDPVTKETTYCGRLVSDHSKKVMYYMPEAGVCNQQADNLSFYQCIPNHATYEGSYSLGAVSYNKWRYQADSNVVIITGVTPDSCIPVTHELQVTDADSTVHTSLFVVSSYQTGLSDTDGFTLDAECNVPDNSIDNSIGNSIGNSI